MSRKRKELTDAELEDIIQHMYDSTDDFEECSDFSDSDSIADPDYTPDDDDDDQNERRGVAWDEREESADDVENLVYFREMEDDLRGETSGTFKRMMVSLCMANRDESMITNIHEAQTDAQALLTAGDLRLGTDESTFNAILCQRNYAQLQLIFQEYEKTAGHDIEDAIKSEFSGNSESGFKAIVRAIKNQADFFARQLHDSVSGMGTNDQKLIRLVVTRCEIDMEEIKRAYQSKYGESLKEAIKDDVSGNYKKCLLALIGEY